MIKSYLVITATVASNSSVLSESWTTVTRVRLPQLCAHLLFQAYPSSLIRPCTESIEERDMIFILPVGAVHPTVGDSNISEFHDRSKYETGRRRRACARQQR
jgi:hypothetical protein